MVSGVAGAALAQLRAGLDALLSVETWQLGAGDVAELVPALAGEASRVAAVQARVLAEAAERHAGAASGFISTAGWYAAVTGTRAREATPAVALATALAGPSAPLAPTAEALSVGALSVEHAGVIHRVMERLAQAVRTAEPDVAEDTLGTAQAFLVDQAERLDPDQLAAAGKHLVARVRSLHEPDAGEREAARAEDRALNASGVSLVQTEDGTWVMHALLDPVGGATVAAALDAGSAPTPAGPDGTRDPRTPARRRRDALVHLADTALAAEPGTAGSRPRLTVAVDARTLLDPWAHGAAPGELTVPGCGDALGGHPLAPSTLSMLACDGELVPVLVGVDGAPLDVGQTQYAFPEKVRKAIAARDRECTFPHHCRRPPSWCQVHHLIPFADGGPTSERNGALVCTPAHLVVHRQGWTAHLDGDQVIWTPPQRGSTQPVELRGVPPWKPALDHLITRWRGRLRIDTAAPRTDAIDPPDTG